MELIDSFCLCRDRGARILDGNRVDDGDRHHRHEGIEPLREHRRRRVDPRRHRAVDELDVRRRGELERIQPRLGADLAEIRMRSDPDGAQVGFDPVGLKVAPGTTVRWAVEANVHTATAYHPANGGHPLRIPEHAAPWDSGYLAEPGQTFEVTLTVEGVYDYFAPRTRQPAWSA